MTTQNYTQNNTQNITYETALMCFYRTHYAITGAPPDKEQTDRWLSWSRNAGDEKFNKWYNKKKIPCDQGIVDIARTYEHFLALYPDTKTATGEARAAQWYRNAGAFLMKQTEWEEDQD
jgi:hypothetical protein